MSSLFLCIPWLWGLFLLTLPCHTFADDEEIITPPRKFARQPVPSLDTDCGNEINDICGLITARRRGRPKKVAVEVDDAEDTTETITINLDDLIDIPEATSPPRKRKAPPKPISVKYVFLNGSTVKIYRDCSSSWLISVILIGRVKLRLPLHLLLPKMLVPVMVRISSNARRVTLRLGSFLLVWTAVRWLWSALHWSASIFKVVQLVRHIRAQHGDDPEYDSKIKEARSLEAKVQTSSSPRKVSRSNHFNSVAVTLL